MGKKRWVRVAWIGGTAAVALIVFLIVLPGRVANGVIRPRLESALSRRLNRRVSIGRLDISVLHGRVRAARILIADSPGFSRRPFAEIPAIQAHFHFWPLLFGRTVVSSIHIMRPRIRLLRNRRGDWNVASMGRRLRSAAPPGNQRGRHASQFDAERVQVEQGAILIAATADPRDAVHIAFHLAASQVRPERTFPLSLVARVKDGGTIHAAGTVGPLDARNAAAALTVTARQLTAAELARMALVLGYHPRGFAITHGTVNTAARVAGRLVAPDVAAVVSGYGLELSHLRLPDASLMTQLGISGGTGRVKIPSLHARLAYHPGILRLQRLFAETSFGAIQAHGRMRLGGAMAFIVLVHPTLTPHHHGLAGLIGGVARLMEKTKHANVEMQISGTARHPIFKPLNGRH